MRGLTRFVLVAAAALHLLFAIGELYPWNVPILLERILMQPAFATLDLGPAEMEFIGAIVHNCGVFNLIMTAGFVWAAFPYSLGGSRSVPRSSTVGYFFSSAAVAAGLAGLILTPLTLVQVAVGVAGVVCCALAPAVGAEEPRTVA